ncbi:MAG: hypothetical protein KME03_06115 [Aphanocapsa lilacina HA4352-LM1]|jgi:chromosome segregation ATPase|nr:hypothetical protein [Aphanocapsa lilacina HA4352-LM1]
MDRKLEPATDQWPLPPLSHGTLLDQLAAELAACRRHYRTLADQLEAARAEANEREAVVLELTEQVRVLGEENRRLEVRLREVPDVYRRKFAGRLEAVAERIERLLAENAHRRRTAAADPRRWAALEALVAAQPQSPPRLAPPPVGGR